MEATSMPLLSAGPKGYRGALNRSGVKAGHSIHSSLDLHISVENSVENPWVVGCTHHMIPSIMLTAQKHDDACCVWRDCKRPRLASMRGWILWWRMNGWQLLGAQGNFLEEKRVTKRRPRDPRSCKWNQRQQCFWICLGLRVTLSSHCALIQVVKPQGCPTFGKGCC